MLLILKQQTKRVRPSIHIYMQNKKVTPAKILCALDNFLCGFAPHGALPVLRHSDIALQQVCVQATAQQRDTYSKLGPLMIVPLHSVAVAGWSARSLGPFIPNPRLLHLS